MRTRTDFIGEKITLISYLEGDCLDNGAYGIDITVVLTHQPYRLTQNSDTGEETCEIETDPVESGLDDINGDDHKKDLIDLAKKILQNKLKISL